MTIMDDLTQYKACRADEIEEGDLLVNLGPVRSVTIVDRYVMIEWGGDHGFAGKVFHANRVLVREAREEEVES